MIYAGIGNREINSKDHEIMKELAKELYLKHNAVLRSGNADGSDKAFQEGAVTQEIYLPWETFNGGNIHAVPVHKDIFNTATAIALKYHPSPNRLRPAVKKLHGRNTLILLGRDLVTPVDFVLCCQRKTAGGTELGIKMALDFNIPVYNIATRTTLELFREEQLC